MNSTIRVSATVVVSTTFPDFHPLQPQRHLLPPTKRLDPIESVGRFRAVYPSHFTPRLLPRAAMQSFVVPFTVAAAAPTNWNGSYPSWLRPPPTLLRPSIFDPLSGSSVVVAQSLAWSQPQSLPLPLPAFQYGSSVFPPPVDVINAAYTCVELEGISGAVTGLITQDLNYSSLTAAELTFSALLTEDLC